VVVRASRACGETTLHVEAKRRMARCIHADVCGAIMDIVTRLALAGVVTEHVGRELRTNMHLVGAGLIGLHAHVCV